MSVTYRKHSNIGNGKLRKLGHVLPSDFSPTILSDFSSSGNLYCNILLFDAKYTEMQQDVTNAKKNKKRANQRFNKAYPCPEAECMMSFDTQQKLTDHESSG